MVAGGTEGWAISGRVAVDGSGNTYVAGSFGGSLSIGQCKLAVVATWPYGLPFVAKLDPAGACLWATPLATGAETGAANDVVVDGTGAAFVVGNVQGTGTFGSTVLTAKGGCDAYVAKIDQSGVVKWAVSAGGTGDDRGRRIALDASGGVVTTGSFSGVASFGPSSVVSAGAHDIFVSRLDPAGNVLWAKAAGGTGGDDGIGVAVPSNGSVFLGGAFAGQASFGTLTRTAAGKSDGFVAKLTQAGEFEWVSHGGGTAAWAVVEHLSLDGQGHLLASGWFDGPATFGSTSLTAANPPRMLLAELDAQGTFLWATSPGSGYAGQLAHDGTTGYLTGGFFDKLQAGSVQLGSAGSTDVIVGRFDSSGKVAAGLSVGGKHIDTGCGLAIDPQTKQVRVTGTIQSQGSLAFGATTVSLTGQAHLFVWSLPPAAL